MGFGERKRGKNLEESEGEGVLMGRDGDLDCQCEEYLKRGC